MNEQYKPQKGDIYIERAYYGNGWVVYEYESDWTGWQDKLGYITNREEYVKSLVKDMVLCQEDENGRRYYCKPVTPPRGVTPVPVPDPLPVTPPRGVTPVAASKKAIAVTAHKRESYTRSITARSITFVCAHCGQTVTQQRYPGPRPMYCTPACKKEVEREQTRLRVQRLRAGKKKASQG